MDSWLIISSRDQSADSLPQFLGWNPSLWTLPKKTPLQVCNETTHEDTCRSHIYFTCEVCRKRHHSGSYLTHHMTTKHENNFWACFWIKTSSSCASTRENFLQTCRNYGDQSFILGSSPNNCHRDPSSDFMPSNVLLTFPHRDRHPYVHIKLIWFFNWPSRQIFVWMPLFHIQT